MAQTKKPIASQLNVAQVAINNTLADAEIQTAVAVSYSVEKINEGKGFYNRAVAAVNAQIAATGAQRDTTADVGLPKKWRAPFLPRIRQN